ncbi:MAG: hypothetical protein WC683_01940 [bacterium]
MRALLDSIEEAVRRQPKNEASKSFVFLTAIQGILERQLDGWKFDIDGHRAGTMKGAPRGEDESDSFMLQGSGPDRASLMVSSSNSRDEHMALFHVYGARSAGGLHLRKSYDTVKAGDAKVVASDILAALKKAGVPVGSK